MLKKLSSLLVLILLFLVLPVNVLASVDPSGVNNNKYGIHLADPSNLGDAKNLVNSSGGSWGYVTLVITNNNRDQTSWQKVFDQMRRDKLIPIVRIATVADGDNWQKPDLSQIDSWVNFLNSLNWVIENRYVIIGNEPNHAKEWGNSISPEEYAAYLKAFSEKLKASSPDFFVLPAGLDASAGNTYKDKRKTIIETMDELDFIKRELAVEPDLFNFVDGWTSHSYPNPGFSGSEKDTGRGTIRSYDWELSALKELEVAKTLPVFITETGWIQKFSSNTNGLTADEISSKLSYAFQNVWIPDNRVVAVTPFILDYPSNPFGPFSWKDADGNFYKFYSTVQSLSKVNGNPVQIDDGKLIGAFIFPVQLSGTTFSGFSIALNEGESIWEANNIGLIDQNIKLHVNNTSFSTLEPGQIGAMYFQGDSPKKPGSYELNLRLTRNGNTFGKFYKLKLISQSPLGMKILPLFDNLQKFFDSHHLAWPNWLQNGRIQIYLDKIIGFTRYLKVFKLKTGN